VERAREGREVTPIDSLVRDLIRENIKVYWLETKVKSKGREGIHGGGRGG